MKVAVIHYHLKTGGVTRVIANAARSVQDHEIELLALGSTPPPEDFPCPARIVPQLRYQRPGESIHPAELADSIRSEARIHFGCLPDLWHIHNHALGKNPALTAAVPLLARTAPVLLQIHDFAEDGRPANYAFLQDSLPDRRFYPDANHVHYAVLNGRDRRFLLESGFPPERVHFLPNAVSIPQLPDHSDPTIPAFDFLYPTRAIRRKNVGEALLLAALTPEARFATTLAPDNPVALPTYDNWVALAAELQLPFDFAVGERYPFAQLLSNARNLLTTSVVEGFGLAFLEPTLLRKPLFGRDIPPITEDFKAGGIEFPYLYPKFPIQPDWIDLAKLESVLMRILQSRYGLFRRKFAEADAEEILQPILHRTDGIDFAVLPEDFQENLIRFAKIDSSVIHVLKEQTQFERESAVSERNFEIVLSHYSLKAYSHRYRNLLQIVSRAPGSEVLHWIDPDPLLSTFLGPDNFQPLSDSPADPGKL